MCPRWGRIALRPLDAHGRLLVVRLTRDRVVLALGQLIGVGFRVVERDEDLARCHRFRDAQVNTANGAASRDDVDTVVRLEVQRASVARSTSLARSAAVLRGRPRNVTPYTLTKHAAASAAARANSAPTAGTVIFSAHCGNSGLCSTAWNINHSETKPLKGGSAEIATQPTRTTKLVSGMR